MKITYSAKLLNSESLLHLLEFQKHLFNFISELHFGCKNSLVELHDKAYFVCRKKFGCSSQVIIKSEQECVANYKTCKSNKHKIDKPIKKTNLSLQLDKRIYSKNDNLHSIITLNGREKFEIQSYPKLDELFSKYKHCDPKLFVRNGQVYISFPFEIPETIPSNKTVLGVDLGLRRVATLSTGEILQDKSFLHNKRKIRYKKRQLQSKGTKSAKRKLYSLRRKESRQTRDFVHRLTKQILKTNCGYIAIEDLSKIKDKKKRGISKYKKINRLSQAPFFMIAQFLTYKAALLGKTVIKVNPFFTSQIDSRTGLKDGIRKGCRYYCKDGTILCADGNAARNIAIRSKHPVSYGNILDGQASVTKLNV